MPRKAIKCIENKQTFKTIYYNPSNKKDINKLVLAGQFKDFIQDLPDYIKDNSALLIVEHLSSHEDGREKPHGYGRRVVAAKPIKKGDIICEYLGARGNILNIFKQDEMDKKEKKEKEAYLDFIYAYAYFTTDSHSKSRLNDKRKGIFAHRIRSTASFVNGKITDFNAEDEVVGGRVFFKATRDIAPYEEITIDYGKNYDYSNNMIYVPSISIDNWPNSEEFFKQNGQYYSDTPFELDENLQKKLKLPHKFLLIPQFLQDLKDNKTPDVQSFNDYIKRLPIVELLDYKEKAAEDCIEISVSENQSNISPLILSCLIKNEAMMQYLLNAGVDPLSRTIQNDDVFMILFKVCDTEDEFLRLTKPILKKISPPLKRNTLGKDEKNRTIISLLHNKKWEKAYSLFFESLATEAVSDLEVSNQKKWKGKATFSKEKDQSQNKKSKLSGSENTPKRKLSPNQGSPKTKKLRTMELPSSNGIDPLSSDIPAAATSLALLTTPEIIIPEINPAIISVPNFDINRRSSGIPQTPELKESKGIQVKKNPLPISKKGKQAKEQIPAIRALFKLYQHHEKLMVKVAHMLSNVSTPDKKSYKIGFKNISTAFERSYSGLCKIVNINDNSTYEEIRTAIFNKKLTQQTLDKLTGNKWRDIHILSWFLISLNKEHSHNKSLVIEYAKMLPFKKPPKAKFLLSEAYGRGEKALFKLYEHHQESILAMENHFNNEFKGFVFISAEFKETFKKLQQILNISEDCSYKEIRTAIFNKKLIPYDFEKLTGNKTKDIHVLSWFLIVFNKEYENNRFLAETYINNLDKNLNLYENKQEEQGIQSLSIVEGSYTPEVIEAFPERLETIQFVSKTPLQEHSLFSQTKEIYEETPQVRLPNVLP